MRHHLGRGWCGPGRRWRVRKPLGSRRRRRRARLGGRNGRRRVRRRWGRWRRFGGRWWRWRRRSRVRWRWRRGRMRRRRRLAGRRRCGFAGRRRLRRRFLLLRLALVLVLALLALLLAHRLVGLRLGELQRPVLGSRLRWRERCCGRKKPCDQGGFADAHGSPLKTVAGQDGNPQAEQRAIRAIHSAIGALGQSQGPDAGALWPSQAKRTA
jgi:hypothetical protein